MRAVLSMVEVVANEGQGAEFWGLENSRLGFSKPEEDGYGGARNREWGRLGV